MNSSIVTDYWIDVFQHSWRKESSISSSFDDLYNKWIGGSQGSCANHPNLLMIMKATTADNLPRTLRCIWFARDFDQPIDNLPSSLEKLILGRQFDRPIDNLPAGLKFLGICGEFASFNQPLNNLPSSLASLAIDSACSHPLDQLPEGLQHLSLSYVEEGISLSFLPKKLQSLFIGCEFDPYTFPFNTTPADCDNIDERTDKLPPELITLGLGYDFVNIIDDLPTTLKTLILGIHFNHPLNKLPASLTYLDVCCSFNQPLTNLPPNLQCLKLGEDFNHPLNQLPRTLTKLKISDNYSCGWDNLPPALKELAVLQTHWSPLPDNVPIIRLSWSDWIDW